jgi:hypothetical protein
VPQIVRAQVLNSGLANGWRPEAPAPHIELDGATFRGSEDEVVGLSPKGTEMLGQWIGHHGGSGTFLRLALVSGSEVQMATEVDDGLSNGYRSPQRIHSFGPQPEELPSPPWHHSTGRPSGGPNSA